MSKPVDSSTIGKILYGFLFVMIVPTSLFVWGKATEGVVLLSVTGSVGLGIGAVIGGALIMVTGMINLSVYGDGLPMNAYPPHKLVKNGIYRLISHPIYLGFSLLCVGIAMAFQSPSGLWLVSPIVILGCAALVQGYEKHDLMERFGASLPKPIIFFPSNEVIPPRFSERLSVYLLVLFPWLVIYEAMVTIGVPHDAIVAYLPFEQKIPVYEWTEIFYVSTYLFVFLVPLLAVSSRDLREFSFTGLIATGIGVLLFIVIPFIAPPREFIPRGFLGNLLMWERLHDTSAAAFPSFHVIWILLAVRIYGKAIPSLKILWWSWTFFICISCITTGMHAIVDVLAAGLVVLLVTRISMVWEKLRSLSERVANSWKEWRIGSVRIINHGIYAGLGTFLGLSINGILLGPHYIIPNLIVAFSGLIMAGLWAQFVEGSPSLLRPFGYYGGVIGVVIGSLVASLFNVNIWLLLGVYGVTGNLIQAAGRLRCLVQGCCHGKEASPSVGIRYTHPRSRVCRLSNFTNVPIHPTPLYSILWNIFTGLLLARLWSLHASPPLIAGLYLILNGLGRFVEESYRGEPQTLIIGKLRLYQFIAMLTVVFGAIITTLKISSEVPNPQFSWTAVIAAFGFGLVTWFALGVDFPNANKRFSRLV
jgi:protein-S-isoprenylcysteine O-methyltransferase Ste14